MRELRDKDSWRDGDLTILDLSYTGLEVIQGQIGRSLLQTGEIHDCEDNLDVRCSVVQLCFVEVE